MMAMSNAEKVRAFREREKNKKKAEMRKAQAYALSDIFVMPFFEFLDRNGNTSNFEQTFDMMGMDAPVFTDDSGPKSAHGMFENDPDLKESTFPDAARSLARAELMIGCLLDAATSLAGIVNDFKKREIDARIAEVTPEDLTDPDRKQATFSRIVALTKMREQLDKEIRWPVRQWNVETT